MGKYVDMVRQRAIQKRQELEQNSASIQQQLVDMAIAEKFLRHPKGFAVSQPIMSLVVLKFLGYSDAEINDLYWKLVYEQSTQGQYRYVDPDAVETACSGEKQQPSSLGLFLFHSYIFKGIPVSAVPFSEQDIAGLLHKMINSDANYCRKKCRNDQCQRNVGYKNLISPKCFLQDQKRGALHDIDGIGILSAESQYLSIQEENQT